MEFSVLDETLLLLKRHDQVVEAPAQGRVGVSVGATTRITGRPSALLHWCKATENAVIGRRMADARVFAGFEAFSRTRFAADRYRRLGSVSEGLYVVGAPDAPLEFPVTASVAIESGPLLREWFLLVTSGAYQGLLTARDLDGLAGNTSPRDRRFEGVITHHAQTIRALSDRLMSEIDQALR